MKAFLRGAFGAIASVCLLAGPVGAATIIVTPATINSAFAAARGGDTLRLVGAFGLTRLLNKSFNHVVTLDASRATFTNTLDISNVDNLKVSGGRWDVTAGSAYGKGIVVYGGSNIWLDRDSITGAADEHGVNFQGTSGATVTNGVFNGLRAGVVFGAVTNGTVSRNKIYGSASDGIDIADSHFVTANLNSCASGVPGPSAHPDCIQLWSIDGHPVQSDINITYNSASGPTQGFTSFSAGGGGLRIQITHNTVMTSYPQGVACYECVDSIIAYNTLSTMIGAKYMTNLNVYGGSGNTVRGNVIKPYAHPSSGMPLSAGLEDGTFVDGGLSGATVPEPSSWALLIVGFGVIGLRRRAAGVTASVVA